ncbi:hypothetical protein Tco_0547465 [Tanacetum coccineum]
MLWIDLSRLTIPVCLGLTLVKQTQFHLSQITGVPGDQLSITRKKMGNQLAKETPKTQKGGVVEFGEKQEYEEMIIVVVGKGGRVMVMRRLRRQMGMNLWREMEKMSFAKVAGNCITTHDTEIQHVESSNIDVNVKAKRRRPKISTYKELSKCAWPETNLRMYQKALKLQDFLDVAEDDVNYSYSL